MKRSLVAGLAFGALAIPAPAADATFAGQNGVIGFNRMTFEPFQLDIWATTPDGASQNRLVRGRGVAAEVAYSPDGRLIAYNADRGEDTPVEIYVANADGSGERRLTRLRKFSSAPSWSPDGTTVAFMSDAGSPRPRRGFEPKFQVHTVRVDGTGLRKLPTRNSVFDPVFSPDGTMIAVSIQRQLGRDAFDSRLGVMAANGSGLRPITAANGPAGPSEINPEWAPDGSRLLLEVVAGSRGRQQSDIASLDPVTGVQTFLTRTRSHETNPVFSPDGTRIAFTSDRSNRSLSRDRLGRGFELYTMAADGTDIRRLTRNRRPDIWPAWQPLR